MRLRKLGNPTSPIKRESSGSGKVTYHKKILGAKLGEVIWIEITEKEYKEILNEQRRD